MAELIDSILAVKNLATAVMKTYKLTSFRMHGCEGGRLTIHLSIGDVGFHLDSDDGSDQSIRDALRAEVHESIKSCQGEILQNSIELALLQKLDPSPLMQLAKCADETENSADSE